VHGAPFAHASVGRFTPPGVAGPCDCHPYARSRPATARSVHADQGPIGTHSWLRVTRPGIARPCDCHPYARSHPTTARPVHADPLGERNRFAPRAVRLPYRRQKLLKGLPARKTYPELAKSIGLTGQRLNNEISRLRKRESIRIRSRYAQLLVSQVVRLGNEPPADTPGLRC
jgi:hypothetical protein